MPSSVSHAPAQPQRQPQSKAQETQQQQQQQQQQLRILHLSDTHGKHRQIEERFGAFPPDVDILIHTGDYSDDGTDAETADFDAWLGEIKQRYRIPHAFFISGNHDVRTAALEIAEGKRPVQDLLPGAEPFWDSRITNARVLKNELVDVGGLKIFGVSWCVWHDSKFAEGEPRPRKPQLMTCFELMKPHMPPVTDYYHTIPAAGVDMLLTHGPAYGVFDNVAPQQHWGGSKRLREEILRKKPKAHLFGHLHEQRCAYLRQQQQQGEGASWHVGGIEYVPDPSSQPDKTFPTDTVLGSDFPDGGYPVELISNNAMANHPDWDRMPKCIVGRPRLIVATRAATADAKSEWSFSLPRWW